jgi:hypothetical protein
MAGSQLPRLRQPTPTAGYSEDAVRHKVKNGTWVQGRIWRKAPDGRIFVNIDEFERWVESDQQATAH